MLNKKTGYIKVSRFAETTFDEFQEHAAKLRAKGMENLVLDLRGNGGGFLSTAVKICDEFLDNEQVIVSTEGKAHPKEIMTATGSGILGHIHLAILIDENSASASEIVAGAIQDNDRGIIIGRRSFGKGLVQREVMLSDSSAIRLTIARYYTPTGRCIQKPYDNLQEYYKEEYYRSLSGELLHEDSIHHKDSLKFVTPKGKTVYGGGGITPDVFVPIDTAGQTSFLSDLFTKGLINQYSFSYADKNRNTLLKEGYDSYYKNFTIDGRMLNDFLSFSYSQGVKKNIPELERSKHIIKNLLKAGIARQIWKNDGFFPILYQNDREIQKAIEELNKNTPL
jgi:carboxyl-terminal processing protease